MNAYRIRRQSHYAAVLTFWQYSSGFSLRSSICSVATVAIPSALGRHCGSRQQLDLHSTFDLHDELRSASSSWCFRAPLVIVGRRAVLSALASGGEIPAAWPLGDRGDRVGVWRKHNPRIRADRPGASTMLSPFVCRTARRMGCLLAIYAPQVREFIAASAFLSSDLIFLFAVPLIWWLDALDVRLITNTSLSSAVSMARLVFVPTGFVGAR